MGYLRQGNIKFAIRMASLPKSMVSVDGKAIMKQWDHIEIRHDALDEEAMEVLSGIEGRVEVLSANGNYIFSGARFMHVSERTSLMSFDECVAAESDDPWDEYTI